jgi:hypothetical protein
VPNKLDTTSYEKMTERDNLQEDLGDETSLEETSLNKYDPFQNFTSGIISII